MDATFPTIWEETSVQIPVGRIHLPGNLAAPIGASGIVLLIHGIGSSRNDPLDRYLARKLHRAGLATVRMDLITGEEEQMEEPMRHLRFNVEALAERLAAATDWLAANPWICNLSFGYLGIRTGAAAALIAAAQRVGVIRAVVSLGDRPDLARGYLSHVYAPTLLIVGENDFTVIPRNEDALEQLRVGEKRLEIVTGATRLYDEMGTARDAAQAAAAWFAQHLGREEQYSSWRQVTMV